MIAVKDLQQIATEIQALIERHIHDDSLFVVEVLAKGGLTQVSKIVVLLDGDQGVSIDQCVAISRSVSEELESLPYLEGKYTFEVSSPGVEYPLRSIRQYAQHVGRRLQVHTKAGQEHIGTLLAVGEARINLEEETLKGAGKSKKYVAQGELEIPFEEIETTSVMISFN